MPARGSLPWRAGGLPNRDRGDFAGRVGGGMDFYVTENWVLVMSANYQLPASKIDRFQYLTVAPHTITNRLIHPYRIDTDRQPNNLLPLNIVHAQQGVKTPIQQKS